MKNSEREKEFEDLPVYKTITSVKIKKDEIFFGPGIAHLMILIEQYSSMKDACSDMGISYTKGWMMINRAENQLGYTIVSRRHGGKSGGKTTLTSKGKDLLVRFKDMEAKIAEYAAMLFREEMQEFF